MLMSGKLGTMGVRAFHLPSTMTAATLLAVALGVAAALAKDKADAPQTCTLQAGPTRSVVRVLDAETVLLDDHQEVRLIGALAPRSPDLSPSAQPWRPEEEATAALRALVLGRSVSLATSGRLTDRYGRRLAHLFVEQGGERVWVQGELLATGHARAYGLPGSYACMPRDAGARARRTPSRKRPVGQRRLRGAVGAAHRAS